MDDRTFLNILIRRIIEERNRLQHAFDNASPYSSEARTEYLRGELNAHIAMGNFIYDLQQGEEN